MVTELAARGKNELIEFDFEKIVFILNVSCWIGTELKHKSIFNRL